MSHNIHTERVGTDPDGQTVLTVADSTAHGEIRFQKPIYDAARIVIESPEWTEFGETGANLVIAGEDLYALRELLNELPEEAFVRPAAPVEEFVTIKDGDGDWWVQEGDQFRAIWTTERGAIQGGHLPLAQLESQYGIDDGKPEWLPGDVVIFTPSSRRFTTTYTRQESGNWARVSGQIGLDGEEDTDEQINNRLKSNPSQYRAIRKLGVDQ